MGIVYVSPDPLPDPEPAVGFGRDVTPRPAVPRPRAVRKARSIAVPVTPADVARDVAPREHESEAAERNL